MRIVSPPPQKLGSEKVRSPNMQKMRLGVALLHLNIRLNWKILSTQNLKKHDFFLRNEACTSMTDFLISGFECSLSLCLSLLVTVWMWPWTLASFDPFPIHASAFHSSAMCIMPQVFCQSSCPTLLVFNDWAIPGFHPHPLHPMQRISGGDLTSKQVWSQCGGMGHGGARGPGNLSPQTAPNHHTIMGHHTEPLPL